METEKLLNSTSTETVNEWNNNNFETEIPIKISTYSLTNPYYRDEKTFTIKSAFPAINLYMISGLLDFQSFKLYNNIHKQIETEKILKYSISGNINNLFENDTNTYSFFGNFNIKNNEIIKYSGFLKPNRNDENNTFSNILCEFETNIQNIHEYLFSNTNKISSPTNSSYWTFDTEMPISSIIWTNENGQINDNLVSRNMFW